MSHSATDSVQPRFSSIRVSIIDFLGMFLPGLAWTGLLLICLSQLGLLAHSTNPRSPLDDLAHMVTHTHPAAYYAAALLIALIIGYAMAAVSATPAEWVVFGGSLALSVLSRWVRMHRRPYVLRCFWRRSTFKRLRGFLFPYYRHYCGREYYRVLMELVEGVSGVPVRSLPTPKGPFSSCKRLLRLRVPELWEEAEYNEALVRMFNSLFLFSVVHLVLAIGSSREYVLVSVLAVAILGWGLSKKRRREVAYVYLNTLLAQQLLRKSLGRQ